MGFLHKIWDETLAGPTPENGLGKLRKYDSFPSSAAAPRRTPAGEEVAITRSITILRTGSNHFKNLSVNPVPGSPPESPAASSTPRTPLTPGTPSGDFRRVTRKKSSTEALEQAEPRSPTIYDWIVMSALDR